MSYRQTAQTIRANLLASALVALVGTSVAPWMPFYLQAAVVEKGITVKDEAESRIEVIVGCLVMVVVAFFTIVACAAAIWEHQPRGIESAARAASISDGYRARINPIR